jgi:hypothetical protein
VSEEERNTETPDPQADIATAIPQRPPDAGKEWKMPEPVFRQTSGYLPQGFEKRYPVSTADAPPSAPPPPVDPFLQTFVGTPGISARDLANGPETPAAPAAPVGPGAAIEPQPELAEALLPEETAEPKPAKKERGRAAKMVFAVMMVIGAVAFILVFLAVVYYLFLMPAGDSGTF